VLLMAMGDAVGGGGRVFYFILFFLGFDSMLSLGKYVFGGF
jgi:hypothetical protein